MVRLLHGGIRHLPRQGIAAPLRDLGQSRWSPGDFYPEPEGGE
ncbi:hypothetical protein E2C01_088560 [Portunus trituberculatus]|uniref:Uncharacterized protein n=1 Tax=Portunus trituberculatus TaxID=210409 RepID=A0A5B7JM81_PORTR|nr:hypothetical protein [Portunus trituberculatus]